MRFYLYTLLLCFGCATPEKGTADTAKPLRPLEGDDGATDGGGSGGTDGGGSGAGATDGGGTGGVDTGEEPEEVNAPYALRVTPSDVDFGAIDVGVTSNQMVDIKNVGTESVHINGIGVSDRTVFDYQADFAVPVTLTPGMERSVRVDFTPSEDRGYTGEITLITEEVLDESADIPLQGRGRSGPCEVCSPVIDVSPRSLSLEAIFCDASGTVSVANVGDRPLRLTGVNVINDTLFMCGNFTRTWGGPVTLAPLASTEITVTYRATDSCQDLVSLGGDVNTMHIYSDDPDDPDFVVELSGYALACGIF